MAADKIVKGTACFRICATVLPNNNFRYHVLTASATDPLSSVVVGDNATTIINLLTDTNFEIDAGASLTLTYFTRVFGAGGGAAAPSQLILRVYYETGTGNLVRELHNGAPPATGTTYTFYGTSDGLVGGAARAGTLRLYIQAILTGTPLGAGDYNGTSDDDATVTGGANVDTSTANVVSVQGALRSNAKVSDITVNAYPSGTNFAYGVTTPEVITATVSRTQKYADRNNEIIKVDFLDSAAVQIAGSNVEDAVASTHTLTQNVNTQFDLALNANYGIRYTIVNDALLIPTSGAIKWTKLIDDGANVTVNGAGTEAERQAFFSVDPRIRAFKEVGLTNLGVAAHSTSGRTVTQDIFKRTGAVNTTNAIPFLSAYMVNSRTQVLATTDFTAATTRGFDGGAIDSQALTTDANGRLTWNFTVSATAAAFNRYVKSGQARQTGSHVATGPDSAASPPATFSLGNGDRTAPFPGYPRTVTITGRELGSNEPSVAHTSVFGTNSEATPDDMWTGPLASAALNANGVPTGPGSREQTLGAGSLKTKWSSLINEGTIRVIDLTDFCVKDVAGRDIDLAGTESIFLRRALFNDTADTVDDAGTSLSDPQTSLDDNATFGYHTGTNSLDTIAAPADGASFKYWLGGSDVSATRTAFALTVSGGSPIVGFNADTGNFGYFEQPVSFAAADLTIGLALTPEVAQSDPTVTRRFGARVFRVAPDDTFVSVAPDAAPIYVVYGLNANGSLTQIANGSMTAVPATTSDFYFDLVTPTGYSAVKIHAFAKVAGSRTPGGSEASVQVGYSLDGTDFLTKIPYK